MAKFKVIVSDPETGTSKVVELEESRATPLIGRKIGEVIDGVPMRPSVHGGVRRNVILSGGVGFNPHNKGERKRKAVRGNVITDEIVQVNTKIVEKPKKPKEDKAEPKKKAQATSST
jgi:small subunit ribosomal protein S6e